METKIKKIPESKIQLDVELGAEEFEVFIGKAIGNLGKDIEVPGFRKGKASKEVIVKEVGQDMVLKEGARLAIEESYRKAVLEYGLEPISQPQVQILKLAPQNPFCYKAVFSILPNIQLPDYKKIASGVKRKKVSITEEEIGKTIKWLQNSRANLKTVSRPAKKNDFIEIEFSSPQIENNKKREDAFIIGKGHLIPGFEKELEGMEPSQEKKFSLRFPDKSADKNLAGKEIEFSVKVEAVKQVDLPEIDDNFAKGLGDFKDMPALKESIKQGLTLEKKAFEARKRQEEVLSMVEKKCQFIVPKVLTKTQKERRFQDLKTRVSKEIGISFEDYLKKIKKTEKELLESLEKESEKEARRFLILREIAKKEDITISEQEIEQEVNKILSRPDKEQLETASQPFDLARLKSYTKERLRNEKVLAKLEEFCNN